MTCIIKKQQQQKINMVSKSGLDPLVSLVIRCLYKEFSEKHFIIFTVYNSKMHLLF